MLFGKAGVLTKRLSPEMLPCQQPQELHPEALGLLVPFHKVAFHSSPHHGCLGPADLAPPSCYCILPLTLLHSHQPLLHSSDKLSPTSGPLHGLSWLSRTFPPSTSVPPTFQDLKQDSSHSLSKESTLGLQSTCHKMSYIFTSFILSAKNVLSICCGPDRHHSEIWRIYW